MTVESGKARAPTPPRGRGRPPGRQRGLSEADGAVRALAELLVPGWPGKRMLEKARKTHEALCRFARRRRIDEAAGANTLEGWFCEAIVHPRSGKVPGVRQLRRIIQFSWTKNHGKVEPMNILESIMPKTRAVLVKRRRELIDAQGHPPP